MNIDPLLWFLFKAGRTGSYRCKWYTQYHYSFYGKRLQGKRFSLYWFGNFK